MSAKIVVIMCSYYIQVVSNMLQIKLDQSDCGEYLVYFWKKKKFKDFRVCVELNNTKIVSGIGNGKLFCGWWIFSPIGGTYLNSAQNYRTCLRLAFQWTSSHRQFHKYSWNPDIDHYPSFIFWPQYPDCWL